MKKLINKFLDRMAVKRYKSQLANQYLDHFRELYNDFMTTRWSDDEAYGRLFEARYVLRTMLGVPNDTLLFIEEMEDKKHNND